MSELVLSRAFCRFSRFDLARLPADKRRGALNFQLQQWSPYPKSGFAITWHAGFASVWCWDQQLLDAATSGLNGVGRGFRVIPETLLRARHTDGVCQVPCLEGFEAQHWQDAQLITSRWWPTQPTARELQAFQRDCNLPHADQLAELPVLASDLAQRPWSRVHASGAEQGLVSLPEATGYGLLFLALAVPAMSLAIDRVELERAFAARMAERDSLANQARPLLEARDAALSAAAQAKAIAGLQNYPSPLLLMAAVARAMPEGGAYLKEWEMSDGKLKLLVSSPSAELVGASYVSALEKAGLFSEVKLLSQADPKQMGFLLSLKTQDALDLQNKEAASSSQEQAVP